MSYNDIYVFCVSMLYVCVVERRFIVMIFILEFLKSSYYVIFKIKRL